MHFGMLQLRDVVTTLILRYYNVAATSPWNVTTTFSTDVGETFISNVMATLIQQISPDVMTTL